MEIVRWIEGEDNLEQAVARSLDDADLADQQDTEERLTTLSVTRVNMFLRCPRQFYYRYLEGLKMPPRSALGEGKALHRALATAHLEQKKSGVPPLSLVLDAHQDYWKEEQKTIAGWDSDDTPDKVDKRGKSFLTQYHQELLPKVQPEAVEKGFVAMVGGFKTVGFIDLLDGSGAKSCVIDHKVVKKAQKAKGSKQLTLYAKVFGAAAGRFNLFKKLKNPVIESDEATFEEQDFLKVEMLFSDVGRAIKMCYANGLFPRCDTEGWVCSPDYCGYYTTCWRKPV